MPHRPSIAFSLPLALVLSAAAVGAEDRELGAHEHGAGAFNIAFEGDQVLMEFQAPGADIVGFEYAAETAEDRARVDEAIALLAKPQSLFVLSSAAECLLETANVQLIAEYGDHDDHHGDKDHEHHKHAHDDHAHDDHAHDEHAHEEHGGHTEFQASYALSCAHPEKIEAIEFAYFDVFPNARELDVQIISGKGATGAEVPRAAPRLDLKGAL